VDGFVGIVIGQIQIKRFGILKLYRRFHQAIAVFVGDQTYVTLQNIFEKANHVDGQGLGKVDTRFMA